MTGLRDFLESMPYEILIRYAEEVFGVVDPEGFKHEDLITHIAQGA